MKKCIPLWFMLASCIVSTPLQLQANMTPKVYNYSSFSTTTATKKVTEELKKLTPKALHSHPEFGILPTNAPCTDCIELLDRRTKNSRYYVKSDTDEKEFFIQKAYGSLHYENDKGFLTTIDTRLQPHPTQQDLVYTPNQPNPVQIDLSTGQATLKLDNGLSFQFNHQTTAYYQEDSTTIFLPNMATAQVTAGDDGVYQTDIWECIDREQIIQRGAVKTNFLLQSLPATVDKKGWLVFEDKVILPHGYTIKRKLKSGIETVEDFWFGALSVHDITGMEVATVGLPTVYDSRVDESYYDPIREAGATLAGYTIQQEGNVAFIRLLVSADWLQSKDRIFPITIDPLTVVSETYLNGDIGFGYNTGVGNECDTTNYCGDFLDITMPGEHQIVGASFEIEYVSNAAPCGPCFLNQAALDLRGACNSTGFIGCGEEGENEQGSCATINPFTGVVQPVDIFDMVSCVPPSCQDQIISFELRTSTCSCASTAACQADTCQYIPDGAWVINLAGRDVEYTATPIVTNPTNTTICEGESIILEVQPIYGVPPYFYTWNEGLSNAASHTVSPTVTTDYAVFVIDACQNQLNTQTVTINVLPDTDPSWTAPTGQICSESGLITLTPTGDAGGVWSGEGVVNDTFNPDGLSGNINITYTTGTAPCEKTESHDIVVVPSGHAAWTAPTEICDGDGSITLNPDAGSGTDGTWTGDGITDNNDGTASFDPANLSGDIEVTYAQGTVPCEDIVMKTITVLNQGDPSWTAPSDLCNGNGTIDLTATNDNSGTWSGTGVTDNNDGTAVFDPTNLSGAISITYETGSGNCINFERHDITVIAQADASWITPGSLCSSANAVTLTPDETTGGTWSGTGVTDNGDGTASFDPAGLDGTFDITYAVGTVPCDDEVTHQITVTSQADASWIPPTGLCGSANAVTLMPSVTTGGTWSGTGVTDNGDGTATFDPAGLDGTFDITYTVGAAPCGDESVEQITVTPQADASWTPPTGLCTSTTAVDLTPSVTTGGVWSGDGITDNGDGTASFDPAGQDGTFSVTYTVGTDPCDNTSTQNIEVLNQADASWIIPTGLCSASPATTLTPSVTTGGVWSGDGITDNGDGTASFDPAGQDGNFSVTYAVGTTPCDNVSTQNIVVEAQLNADWTLPTDVCDDTAPITLTPNGTAGGTWSGTGVIDNGDGTASFSPTNGATTYNITYTVGAAPCGDEVAQDLTVISGGDASWTSPGSLCSFQSPIQLTGNVTTSGTWSGIGVSNSGLFDPSGLSGSYTITYTVGNGVCQSTEDHDIVVVAEANASWTVPENVCSDDDPITLTPDGTPGGSWSGDGIVDNGDGTASFTPANITTTNVTYTVGEVNCQATLTLPINVTIAGNPAWTPPSDLCNTDAPIQLTTTGDTGGTWSGTGVSATGSFDPAGLEGTYPITYTVGANPCERSEIQNITVVAQPTATWTIPNDLCASNPPIDLSTMITGTTGGTWSGDGIVNPSAGTFNPFGLSGSIPITYTVSTGVCEEALTQNITVIPTADASWELPTGLCKNGESIQLQDFITGDIGGIWSGSGIADATTGEMNLFFSPATTEITYTVGTPPCEDVVTQTITIFPNPTASISSDTEACADGLTPITVSFDGIVTNPATANFVWDFGGGIATPGTGIGPHQVTWSDASTTPIVISLTVIENDCPSNEVTQEINLSEAPETPVVNCGISSTTSVSFEWPAIPNTTEYQVIVDGNSGSPEIVNTNSYTQNVANQGDEVTIEVIAVGSGVCGNSIASDPVTCVAENCPANPINIGTIDNQYCQDAAMVVLNATPAEVTYSGDGVTGDMFNPSMAAGEYVITFSLEQDGCMYETKHTVTILPQPSAEFDLSATTTCSDESNSITVTYAGNATTAATFNWDFDGGTAVPGTGIGPHQVTWSTAGTKNISLSVTENDCTGQPNSAEITVTDPLPPIQLACGTSTTSTVPFTWNDVGADSYTLDITINGGVQTTTTVNTNTYTEQGLNVGDNVTIIVTPISSGVCGNGAAETMTCTAESCTPITPTIDGLAANYCTNIGAITLAATPSGGIFSGDGVENGIFNPENLTTGTATITYNYTDAASSCAYEATTTVNIVEPLETAGITLGGASTTSVTFNWGAVPNTTDYEINILVNGVQSENFTTTDLTYTVAGLTLGDEATIQITPIGTLPCEDGPTSSATAPTANCPDVNINIEEVTYCLTDSPITLVPDPGVPSGTFSGTDVVGNIFTPSDAGTFIIEYTYEQNGCSVTEPLAATVLAPLTTPIVSCGNSTTTSIEFVWEPVIGADSYEIIVTNNGTPTTLDNGIATNYLLTGLSEGNTATIEVTALGSGLCGNSATSTPFECIAAACSPIVIAITNDTEYCLANSPITLTANPTGGTFSGTAISGDTFTPDGEGTFTVIYDYEENGCPYQTMLDINIIAPLATPIVSCGEATVSAVIFNWQPIVGATSYEITTSINNDVSNTFTITDTTYTEENLVQGDEVTATVIAINDGVCGNSAVSNEATCTAENCPIVNLTIENLDNTYCANTPAFPLIANPSGGMFSGDGITGETFDPTGLPIGQTTVNYNWINIDDGCDYNTEVVIDIITPLVPPIVSCGLTTTNTVEFIWDAITDADEYEITVSINNNTPTTQTSTDTRFEQTGLVAGDEVSITVIAIGQTVCGNSEASQTVTCDAENCPTQTVNIDNLPVTYCLNSGNITLTATPAGGTFSGMGTTGTNGEILDMSLLSAGLFTIDYTYTDPVTGCVYPTDATIEIFEPIATPILSCGTSTPSSVVFNWNDVGVTDYEISVSINNAPAVTQTLTDLTYMESGLNEGDEVELTVTALNTNICGNSEAATTTCIAQNCPVITLSIDNLNDSYCQGEASVTLTATPAGGTFTGDGVTGDIFDPALVTSDTVIISYTYTDPTSGCGYQVTDTTIVSLNIDPIISNLNDNYCIDEVAFNLTSSFTGGAFDGAGILGDLFTPSLAGVGEHIITHTFTDANGCEHIAEQLINVVGIDLITIPNSIIAAGDSITLTSLATSTIAGDTLTINWTDNDGSLSCTDCLNPVATPTETTTYTLETTNQLGCTQTTEVTITIDNPTVSRVLFPQAFSPNGDGVNDIFRPVGQDIQQVKLHVFNRWGNEIFNIETEDITQGWDGLYKSKAVEVGTYVYWSEITFTNGTSEIFKGNFVIIR